MNVVISSPGECNYQHIAVMCRLNRLNKVCSASVIREYQQQIAGLADCADLFREHLIKLAIMCDAGERRAVGAEG